MNTVNKIFLLFFEVPEKKQKNNEKVYFLLEKNFFCGTLPVNVRACFFFRYFCFRYNKKVSSDVVLSVVGKIF